VTFRFTVLMTLLALAALAVLWVGAIPHFDFANLVNIAPEEGNSPWLPKGAEGILFALPFAIWFYLAIEQLPLAAEESHQPTRDLPRGILLGILTLIVCAFLTLFLNVGIAPGADALATSGEPVLEGYRTIFGEGVGAKVLGLVAVAGLIASFHTIIFAYGRNIYSLSRAGYFPHWLSLTPGTRKTPHVALIAGAVVGYLVLLILHLLGQGALVGATVLNMAVFRRGHRLRHASALLPAPAETQATHRAALRQHARHPRRGGGARDFGDHIPDAVRQSRLSAGDLVVWPVVPCRPRLFRILCSLPYGAIARRGVCAPGDKRAVVRGGGRSPPSLAPGREQRRPGVLCVTALLARADFG
jgi:Amino acid permease